MPPTSPHQSHLITQHEQQAHTLNLNLLINSVQKNSNFRLLPSGSPTTAPFYSPPALTTTHARSTGKNPLFSPHNTSNTKMSTCDLYQLFFPQQHYQKFSIYNQKVHDPSTCKARAEQQQLFTQLSNVSPCLVPRTDNKQQRGAAVRRDDKARE